MLRTSFALTSIVLCGCAHALLPVDSIDYGWAAHPQSLRVEVDEVRPRPMQRTFITYRLERQGSEFVGNAVELRTHVDPDAQEVTELSVRAVAIPSASLRPVFERLAAVGAPLPGVPVRSIECPPQPAWEILLTGWPDPHPGPTVDMRLVGSDAEWYRRAPGATVAIDANEMQQIVALLRPLLSAGEEERPPIARSD